MSGLKESSSPTPESQKKWVAEEVDAVVVEELMVVFVGGG